MKKLTKTEISAITSKILKEIENTQKLTQEERLIADQFIDNIVKEYKDSQLYKFIMSNKLLLSKEALDNIFKNEYIINDIHIKVVKSHYYGYDANVFRELDYNNNSSVGFIPFKNGKELPCFIDVEREVILAQIEVTDLETLISTIKEKFL